MKTLKIKITGASGYLGKTISNLLTEKGHKVSGIERKLLYGSTNDLQAEIRNCDAIINLAGSPILQRWTDKNKATIVDSRVKTTQNLVQAINNLPLNEQPKKFISASAIGVYATGFMHDESSQNFDNGFVGSVVKQWEAASNGLSLLKAVLGEASVLLTEGAEVLPRNLTEAGFEFQYPDINSALKEIV
ncbi:MAG: DUF1731 domain-containing protein [Draconibacterium sp.]|nr:DUF1731 domain-containing protein [Draconibacterium sp.]